MKVVFSKMRFNNFFLATILIAISALLYYKSISSQFINWDDNSYVVYNPDIKTLHGDSVSYTLKKTFTGYVMGNYHPVTMLSFCLEYNFFELSTRAYHTTNLILHILNSLLVFWLIYLLCKNNIVGFITALLFAIHPMHAESVLWISERKDLLYTLFYLLALCTYVFYLKSEKHKKVFYILTLFLFILSVLSKGMAVSLPIMLFALDYFFDRKYTLNTFFEKIPFLVISIIFGCIAIIAQHHTQALDIKEYNFFERILFSSYGLITYLWKLLIPVQLTCFYSYPEKLNDAYPLIYYLSPIIAGVIIFIMVKFFHHSKLIIFGFCFFIITIVLVLQILPVGSSIISERYTYIPYIGLFFIISDFIVKSIEANKPYKKILIVMLITVTVLYSFQTIQRVKAWHDSISLWTDAIKKDIDNPYLYDNRGNSYFLENKYDLAVADFTKAISLNYKDLKVFFKRGSSYYGSGKYLEAVNDFDLALKNNKYDSVIFYKKAYACLKLGRYNEAIKNYGRAIKIDTSFSSAYHDRGLVYYTIGDISKAMSDFNKAIQLNKNYTEAYLSRGSVYFISGNASRAIEDYSSAIKLLPDYKDALYNRAVAYLSIKEYKLAMQDVLKAKEYGYDFPENLIRDINAGLNN